jgi:hypothetical protein
MARRREGLAGSLSPRSAVSPRSPRSPWTDSPRGSEVTDASGEMSGDLVQWLERKEQEQEQQLQQQPRATTFSWVLVFSANRDGKGAYVFTNMQEAWNIVERLVDVQLTISHVLSADGARIYLLVGAANRVLEDEAEVAMQLPVRMVLTKGVTPFQAEFKDNYVHSMHDPEGGVFNSAQKQQIVLHRIHRGLLITLTEQEWLWSPQRLLAKLRRRLGAEKPIRGELLRKIFTACGAFRTNAGALLGQTVEKAALVAHNDPVRSPGSRRRRRRRTRTRTRVCSSCTRLRGVLVPLCGGAVLLRVPTEAGGQDDGVTVGQPAVNCGGPRRRRAADGRGPGEGHGQDCAEHRAEGDGKAAHAGGPGE